MRYKPVLSVLKYVGRDRADFLGSVDQTKIKLGSFFSDSVVNQCEVRLVLLRKQVMSFLEIHLNDVGFSVLDEVVHGITEYRGTKTIGVGPLDNRIAL